MNKDILVGIQISLGIILSLSLFFSIVYAIGFHSANEITEGNFNGNFQFNGNLNISNSTLSGLDNSLNTFICSYTSNSQGTGWLYKTWTTSDCEGYLPSNYNHCLIGLMQANGDGAGAWNCQKTKGSAFTSSNTAYQIVMECSYLCWN